MTGSFIFYFMALISLSAGLGEIDGTVFAGRATFYTDLVGANGHCMLNAPPNGLYAAMNIGQYGIAAPCGTCIEASTSTGKVIAQIVDSCPSCGHGAVDFSTGAFEKLAPLSQGVVAISWKYIQCPAPEFPTFPASPVKFMWKEGSSQWWAGLQVRSTSVGVESLTINGRATMKTDYNYFIATPLGKGPFEVVMTLKDKTIVTQKLFNVGASGIEIPGII